MKQWIYAFFVFTLGSGISNAAIMIQVGDHVLEPNKANQPIQLFALAGDGEPVVSAFNLVAQLGDGRGDEIEPVFSGTPGSLEGIDFLTGTIWPSDDVLISGSAPVAGFPQLATASIAIATPGGTVKANGLFATLFVDTTGFDAGTFGLSVSNIEGNDSNFVLMDGNELAPDFNNGSITIVPEPHSFLSLVLLFAIGVLRISRRRR